MAHEPPTVNYDSNRRSDGRQLAARIIGLAALGTAVIALICLAYLLGTQFHLVPRSWLIYDLCHIGSIATSIAAIGFGTFSLLERRQGNLSAIAAVLIGAFLLVLYLTAALGLWR